MILIIIVLHMPIVCVNELTVRSMECRLNNTHDRPYRATASMLVPPATRAIMSLNEKQERNMNKSFRRSGMRAPDMPMAVPAT